MARLDWLLRKIWCKIFLSCNNYVIMRELAVFELVKCSLHYPKVCCIWFNLESQLWYRPYTEVLSFFDMLLSVNKFPIFALVVFPCDIDVNKRLFSSFRLKLWMRLCYPAESPIIVHDIPFWDLNYDHIVFFKVIVTFENKFQANALLFNLL